MTYSRNNNTEKLVEDVLKNFIGIESLFNSVIRNDSFPKYEILKNKTDNAYYLRVLLAGYKKSDLDISLDKGTLYIEHAKKEENQNEDQDIEYLSNKVIAKRAFKLAFRVSPNVEVENADFEDGILTIKFVENNIDTKRVIDIK